MNRRLRGRARLATTILTLVALTACSQPERRTTIKGSRFRPGPSYFAASAAGAFLVQDDRAFTVAEPGAKAQAAQCCSASELTGSTEGSRRVASGSVALDGTPWAILGDNSVFDLKGKEHAAASAVRQLESTFRLKVQATDGKPAINRWVSRSVLNRAVSVVDSRAVLAATWSYYGSRFRFANDSMVFRVSATGAPVAVAGRAGFGTTRPIFSLKVGERVAATGVDLERVQALVALDQDSFVLFMGGPAKVGNPEWGQLQAAVVANGLISRLKLPDLCGNGNYVMTSRISDHEVALNALDGTGNCRVSGNACYGSTPQRTPSERSASATATQASPATSCSPPSAPRKTQGPGRLCAGRTYQIIRRHPSPANQSGVQPHR